MTAKVVETDALINLKPLIDLIRTGEEQLIDSTIEYAKAHGYAQYTSTLVTAWRCSISGLSTPLISALESRRGIVPLGAEDDFEKDPVASFGILEAKRHRERGVTFAMFLGLMKYYRQSYVDLVLAGGFESGVSSYYRRLIDRFFDRVELGFCAEWSVLGDSQLIMALQKKNRAMTNEKNKYLTIFESFHSPVVLLDKGNALINLNQAWAETFNGAGGPGAAYYTPESTDFRHARLARELASLLDENTAEASFERELNTVHGPRHFQISLKKMLDVSDKFAGTVVILNDITKRITAQAQLIKHREYLETLFNQQTSELMKTNILLKQESKDRKEAETVNFELHKQLLHAQKIEAIGTLAGGIAHDFNNILSAILGYSELAKEQVPNEGKIQDYLDEVITASSRAKDLVLQILSFSHRDNLNPRPVQLHIIVKEVLKLLRATIPTTIEIRRHIDTDCGGVLAAPSQIHQIIMNLCANAYHAMKKTGGVLSVSLKSVLVDPDSEETKLGITPGEYAMLSVGDTGHGMDASVREKIFEPYFTTKKKGEGTGLGLSVINGIVQNFGGQIHVQSKPGKGTIFHVYLPGSAVSDTATKVAFSDAAPRGSEHILIVDDEEVLAVMWQQHLELLGYTVTAYSNSEMALQDFKRRPDVFDLVLTDMNMPNITGSLLSKKLLGVRPNIPIILSTGYSEMISEKKAREMGIRAFILKPVLGKELAKTIRQVLGPDKKPLKRGDGGGPPRQEDATEFIC